MVKEQTSGRFLRWTVTLPGLQQQIHQHEQLSGNGNDGLFLTELVLMRPEPIMERRIAYLHSRPGRLAQNQTRGRIFCLARPGTRERSARHPEGKHPRGVLSFYLVILSAAQRSRKILSVKTSDFSAARTELTLTIPAGVTSLTISGKVRVGRAYDTPIRIVGVSTLYLWPVYDRLLLNSTI